MGELETRMGMRIRVAREDLGLTQEEVGAQLRLTAVGYGAFERGDRQVGGDHLLRLAVILRRDVNYLLDVPTPQGLQPDEDELLVLYRRVTNAEIRRVITEMVRSAAGPGR
jgi:transcriptional regulator with XRE-family HTH domain